MRSEIGVNMGAFSERVKAYLRTSGYSQSELADALGIHPKVLSRKLHGNGNARLTHLEIQRVITILAGWHAIVTTNGRHHLSVHLQRDALNQFPPATPALPRPSTTFLLRRRALLDENGRLSDCSNGSDAPKCAW